MHTQQVLHSFFHHAWPEVHAKRREALAMAVNTVVQGAAVSITEMGRGLAGSGRLKHQIKRMDRLVGNRLLHDQRWGFYRLCSERLLTGTARPLILIDWSEFSVDQGQQLLRAAVPVGARAVTLYEELHPQAHLANRGVQHRFLDRLQALLPAGCIPIIVADAGFRGPFYRHVERLGWHWVGRIRNRDFICWEGAPQDWVQAQSVHALATPRAQELGEGQWVRSAPLPARLVLIRHPRQGRQDRSLHGRARRSRLSRQHARRTREPWLLVASRSLQDYSAKQLVRIYKTRMQIEEAFRDTKSRLYGLGIARGRHTSLIRATNLLLIAALASFVLWMIGCLAKAKGWVKAVRVNSSSRTATYSTPFLARLVIRHLPGRLPSRCFEHSHTRVGDYLHTVLCDT